MCSPARRHCSTLAAILFAAVAALGWAQANPETGPDRFRHAFRRVMDDHFLECVSRTVALKSVREPIAGQTRKEILAAYHDERMIKLGLAAEPSGETRPLMDRLSTLAPVVRDGAVEWVESPKPRAWINDLRDADYPPADDQLLIALAALWHPEKQIAEQAHSSIGRWLRAGCRTGDAAGLGRILERIGVDEIRPLLEISGRRYDRAATASLLIAAYYVVEADKSLAADLFTRFVDRECADGELRGPPDLGIFHDLDAPLRDELHNTLRNVLTATREQADYLKGTRRALRSRVSFVCGNNDPLPPPPPPDAWAEAARKAKAFAEKGIAFAGQHLFAILSGVAALAGGALLLRHRRRKGIGAGR